MRYSTLAALAVLAAPLVAAQNISDLPQCAQQPALAGISSTGCSLTDFKCICTSSSFISSLTTAVQQDCDTADQASTLSFAQQLCGSVGVTIPSPSSVSSTSQSGTASTTSTSTATSSSTSTVTSTSTSTSVVAVVTTSTSTTSSSSIAATTTVAVVTNTTNVTASATAAPTVFEGSAAARAVQWVGAVLVGGLALWLL